MFLITILAHISKKEYHNLSNKKKTRDSTKKPSAKRV